MNDSETLAMAGFYLFSSVLFSTASPIGFALLSVFAVIARRHVRDALERGDRPSRAARNVAKSMLVLVVLWMFAWLACEVTFVSAGIHVGLLDAWVWLCNLASLALTVAWVRMVSVSPRSRR